MLFNEISMEDISFQTNNKFVIEIEEKLELIKLKCEELDLNSSIYTEKKFNELKSYLNNGIYDEISEILTKRFGYNLKLIPVYLELSYIPFLFFGSNKLLNITEDKIKQIKDELNNYTEEEINDFLKDNEENSSFIKFFQKEKEFKKMMSLSNVEVDLKNAYIKNFPFKENNYIMFDIGLLFIHNLSIKEIVAVLLHEIGHSFLQIEAMCFSSYINYRFLFLQNKTLKNKDNKFIDKFKYTLLTKYKDDSETKELIEKYLKNSTYKTIAFDLKDLILDYNTKVVSTRDLLSMKEDESHSDRFSTYFGYGEDLVNALVKLEEIDLNNEKAFKITKAVYLFQDVVNVCFGVAFTTIISYGSINLFLATNISRVIIFGNIFKLFLQVSCLLILSYVIIYAIRTFVNVHDREFKSSEILNIENYHDFRSRINDIKSTLISLLKEKSLPNAIKKSILEQIKNVESTLLNLDKLEKSKRNIFFNTFELFKTNKSIVKELDINQILESLSNNNLLVRKEELKLLLSNDEN